MSRLSCSGFALLALFPLIGLSAAAPVNAEPLKVGGTGAALGALRLLGDGFLATRSGAAVEVLPSLGTRGGLNALARGVIDVAVVSRPLSQAEEQSGLRAVRYGVSPLAFVTSRRRPQMSVTLGEVADILAGRRGAWPDGAPIRVVLRPRQETDILILRQHAPILDGSLTAAFARPELPIAHTDQQALDLLEATEGSFGFSALGAILSEGRRLVPLALDGVAPTLDNVANGSYRLVRDFYLLLPPKASPLAEAFVAFVRSPEGKRLLRTVGTIPVEHD